MRTENVHMLITVPVCFSSYNNNIYEDRKRAFSVSWASWNRKNVLKLSWNFLKIGSWSFTSCSWEPWQCRIHKISPLYLYIWKFHTLLDYETIVLLFLAVSSAVWFAVV